MGIFNFLFNLSTDENLIEETNQINPASGLPMVSPGTGGVDVEGNPYGTDSSSTNDICTSDDFNSIDTTSCFDNSFDSFDSGCTSFDDW